MSKKVDGGNGKFYTRDHPHEIISPHIMRFEEIRWWIEELLKPEYGWSEPGLGRALGIGRDCIRRCRRTGWIWPRQQMKITVRIRQIVDGYVVPTVVPTKFGKRRIDGVYTDPPRPPMAAPKRVLKLQATRAGLRFLAQDYRPPPNLPSFTRAFAEVLPWSGAKKRGA